MRGVTAALAAAFIVAALACSSSGGSNDGGGGGGGATGGTGGSATDATCQGIRQCVMDCGAADDACINTCKSRGNTAAQGAFQALYDCTADPARGNCTAAHAISDCVCIAQCYDGACLAETDACVNGGSDVVCDMSCH